jgi:hypothetical protein
VLALVDTVDRHAGAWQSAAIGAFLWISKLLGTLDVRASEPPKGRSLWSPISDFSQCCWAFSEMKMSNRQVFWRSMYGIESPRIVQHRFWKSLKRTNARLLMAFEDGTPQLPLDFTVIDEGGKKRRAEEHNGILATAGQSRILAP